MSKYQNKPLSPHLSIYRPQITSILSISHRVTGFILFVAMTILVWLICAITYCDAMEVLKSISDLLNANILGKILKTAIIIVMFCMFFHLLNGIRHLFWDIGKGFELKSVYRSGYLVIIGAILLTIGISCYIFFN
ncbi:succinate dehydrogenase, cytochrome b556 subunit [Rickettsiales endosymbiont of Stachyamoeba lipophora]|uniref:succinate dehydrogenase, cytochrome b556 subunit n=1 Tax=Rickettsiales endosymbiont of Stachyamoeba lipophora TaxID=2486578 RepID=UPI000F64FB8E|nr:succinate dehydrogenase, cytochrome b556 subunit [Rickettsiales endosymbiont of Stachyamoeba lipophora]AZL16234.1 succinate dehydrogenase, cytochrome b556 subunit [Rickettsiales endosymbiont of Stachyamoeba lipophora]